MLYLSVPQFPFVKKVSSHCLLLTGYVYSRSQKNLQPGPSLALRLECLVGLVPFLLLVVTSSSHRFINIWFCRATK